MLELLTFLLDVLTFQCHCIHLCTYHVLDFFAAYLLACNLEYLQYA